MIKPLYWHIITSRTNMYPVGQLLQLPLMNNTRMARLADGRLLSKAQYPELWEFMRETDGHSYSDDFLFAIPDLIRPEAVAERYGVKMQNMLRRIYEAQYGHGDWPSQTEIKTLIKLSQGKLCLEPQS